VTGVLFVTESYHPVLGGGETHIRFLARALAGRGLGAAVVTRRTDPSWAADEAADGVRVVRVGPAGRGRTGKFLMVPGALRALVRLARAYDVLVVRGTRVLGAPALAVGRLLGKAVVLQPELDGELSGELFGRGQARWRRRLFGAAVRLRNRLFRRADAVIAMSRRIRSEAAEAGLDPGRVALLPHGVDTERFRPATAAEREMLRRERGLEGPGPVLCWTGRLLRGKGLEALVAAFAGPVRAAHPDARLVLVGSGDGQTLSIEDALRAEVARLGLGGAVSFTGRTDDVAPWLRAADLFVFPSEFEALGISLVEAAACGLAAVASRTGGIVDVVADGESGRLVPPGDAGALGAAIVSLLADPEGRAAMGARAREIARRDFDARDSVARYEALFRELAGRRRG
jgi:glycosyltransferase involved in cell wall biosynthesis